MASSSPDRRKLYVRIADELREELAAGRYPLGDTFPSIGELAERFGAAKMTVDRAVDLLRNEGYLESRQGSRTLVIALPTSPSGPAETADRSEEFKVLLTQIRQMREQINHLGTRLDELDERTKRP